MKALVSAGSYLLAPFKKQAENCPHREHLASHPYFPLDNHFCFISMLCTQCYAGLLSFIILVYIYIAGHIAGQTGNCSIFFFLFRSLVLSAPNPCDGNDGRGPCSHLCLINYHQTFSCACPHLMKLGTDRHTCYGNIPPPPFTVLGPLALMRTAPSWHLLFFFHSFSKCSHLSFNPDRRLFH